MDTIEMNSKMNSHAELFLFIFVRVAAVCCCHEGEMMMQRLVGYRCQIYIFEPTIWLFDLGLNPEGLRLELFTAVNVDVEEETA